MRKVNGRYKHRSPKRHLISTNFPRFEKTGNTIHALFFGMFCVADVALTVWAIHES